VFDQRWKLNVLHRQGKNLEATTNEEQQWRNERINQRWKLKVYSGPEDPVSYGTVECSTHETGRVLCAYLRNQHSTHVIRAFMGKYTNKLFGDHAILALSFGLAPHGGIHIQFERGKPPETPNAPYRAARIKDERWRSAGPGFEPGRAGPRLTFKVDVKLSRTGKIFPGR
jgi:hypothetical protein